MAKAILFAASLALGWAPASACEMMSYQRVQASPRVHVLQAAEGTTGVVNGNIVVVLGRDATLVVDTGQFPSIARRALADIRALSPAPIRYVVNTHWHGDHLLANSVFKEAYPQARFIAHAHTIEQGARFYADYSTRMGKRLPAIVEDMRKKRGASASEEERLWLDRTLACVDRAAEEIGETRYLPPDQVVNDELRVELGGLHVIVKHLGTANTPGDLVVWIPEEKIVAVGDMVVHPVPYAIGSTLAPWIRTLGRLRALGAATFIPGHGPLLQDERYLRDLEALLESTRSQLARLHARGVSRAEAERQLDTAAFREKYVTTPMRRQAFEQFFVKAAVAQVWTAAPNKD